MIDPEKWTDAQLVKWAIANGWRYWHVNDQLQDPFGGLTTANNWEDIGQWRREMIIKQMTNSK